MTFYIDINCAVSLWLLTSWAKSYVTYLWPMLLEDFPVLINYPAKLIFFSVLVIENPVPEVILQPQKILITMVPSHFCTLPALESTGKFPHFSPVYLCWYRRYVYWFIVHLSHLKHITVINKVTSFSSVQFSLSVVSDSLRPRESQHARPPCPSPTPRVHWDSR